MNGVHPVGRAAAAAQEEPRLHIADQGDALVLAGLCAAHFTRGKEQSKPRVAGGTRKAIGNMTVTDRL